MDVVILQINGPEEEQVIVGSCGGLLYGDAGQPPRFSCCYVPCGAALRRLGRDIPGPVPRAWCSLERSLQASEHEVPSLEAVPDVAPAIELTSRRSAARSPINPMSWPRSSFYPVMQCTVPVSGGGLLISVAAINRRVARQGRRPDGRTKQTWSPAVTCPCKDEISPAANTRD
jgi:hypothetical protein